MTKKCGGWAQKGEKNPAIGRDFTISGVGWPPPTFIILYLLRE